MPRVPQVKPFAHLKPQARFLKQPVRLPGGLQATRGVFLLVFGTILADIYHNHWSFGTLKMDIGRLEKDIGRLDKDVGRLYGEIARLNRTVERNHQDLKMTMQMLWGKGVYEEQKQQIKKGNN